MIISNKDLRIIKKKSMYLYFYFTYKELDSHLHELTIEHETLKSRPPEVVTKVETKVVEKIPSDYENLKKMVSTF